VVDPNLISYWRLDEAVAGSVAHDYGWAAANATDNAAATTISTAAPTSFAYGNPSARHFPGSASNGVLTAGVVAAHVLTNNFTVAAWIRPSSVPNPAAGIVCCLDSRTPAAGGATGGGWSIVSQNNGVVCQTCSGSALTNPAYYGTVLPVGIWTHVAARVQSGVVALFINGYQQGTTGSPTINTNTSMPTNIGNYPSQALGYPFNGDLDDIRIYSVALSNDQMASLGYGNEPNLVAVSTKIHSTDCLVQAVPEPNLISWWKLDEIGTGQVAHDYGIADTLTTDAAGTTTNSTTAPVAAPLNYPNPSGRLFPGSNTANLSAGAPAQHQVNDNFTWSLWCRAPSFANWAGLMSRASGTGSGTNNGYSLCTQPPNGMVVWQSAFTDGSTWNYVTSDVNLAPNVWNHVLVGQTSGTRFMWVNGVKQSQTNSGATIAPGATVPTLLGALASGSTWNWLGDLDDIRFYNIVLNVDQILSLAVGNDPYLVGMRTRTHTTDADLSGSRTLSHGTDCRVVDGRLVSYWKLDETGTGAMAPDYGWAGANATDVAGTTTVSTPAPTNFANPNGRHFPNTTNAYLNAGNPAAHAFADNFTLALWARPTALASNYGMLGRWNNVSGAFGGWNIANSSAGVQWMMGTGASTTTIFSTGTSFVAGQWTHVTCKQTSGNRQIYVNGVKSGTPSAVAWIQPPAANPTLVGNSFTSGQVWNGDLDDVRIYNVALTDDQISSLGVGNEPFLVTIRTKTHTTDCQVAARLISWYKLDEASSSAGLTANDSGIANAPATDTGGTTNYATLAPTTAPVNFANPYARNFPGGTYLVTATPTTAHSLTSGFAVSAWVRTAGSMANQPIIAHQNTALTEGWGLKTDGSGQFYTSICSAGSAHGLWNAGQTCPVGVWTHVCMNMSGSTRANWVNGKKGGTQLGGAAGASTDLATVIGREYSDSATYTFNGDLDDIRIYAPGLTDDQVRSLAVGNDPMLVTLRTVAHTADLYKIYTWTRTHTTDTDKLGSVAKTHTSDSRLWWTTAKGHTSDAYLVDLRLISYWKLDETGSWTTAVDSGYAGANAADNVHCSQPTTQVPTTAPTNFPNPRARNLNPSGYLDAGQPSAHSLTANFTVAAWVRPQIVNPCPVVGHTNSVPQNQGWVLYSSGNTPMFSVSNATTTANTPCSTAKYVSNVWQHVCGVCYSASQAIFYNGAQQGTNVTGQMPAATSGINTYLGRDYSNYSGFHSFMGDMDEVRIYSIALTNDQIQSLAGGNDPFQVVYRTTWVHTTDIAKLGTTAKTHNTNALLQAPGTAISHVTNSELLHTTSELHSTDVLRQLTSTRGHNTNSELLHPASVLHSTDARVAQLVTSARTHTSDAALRGTITRGHQTDSRASQLLAATRTQTVDALKLGTSARSHGTDTQVAKLGTPTLAHGTSTNVIGLLVSWWKLDEPAAAAIAIDSATSGANATDFSGTTTTAAPPTAPLSVANPYARHLPGNTYLDAGIQAIHSFTTNFTISAWVRVPSVANDQPFVYHSNWPMTQGWALGTFNGFAGFAVANASTGTNLATTSTPFPLNTWVHVCGIMYPTFGRLFVNGARQLGTAAAIPDPSPNVHTYLGQDSTTPASKKLTGDLDDVRFYNAQLNNDQIQALAGGNDPYAFLAYNKPFTTNSYLAKLTTSTRSHSTDCNVIGALVGWWKLDEAITGVAAIDSSPLGATAINAANGIGRCTTPPIGAPLNFPNLSGRTIPTYADYFDAGDQPIHGFIRNCTISGWIRYPDATTDGAIVSRMNAGGTSGWNLSLNGTYACLEVGSSVVGFNSVWSDNPLDPDVWVHVCGTFDLFGPKIYVNGAQQSDLTEQGLPSDTAGLHTLIGFVPSTGPQDALIADLDDIRLYNALLTMNQIQSLAGGNEPFQVAVSTKTHTTDTYIGLGSVGSRSRTQRIGTRTLAFNER
jgi:hypothetical protein